MSTFIKIEKPCGESWENMHEVAGGRFCDFCNKKVLDLTHLSDSEILKIIENSNGEICGRVYKNQLNRKLVDFIEKNEECKKKNSYSKLVAGIAIATSLTGLNAKSAEIQNPFIQIAQNKSLQKANPEKQIISNDDFVISGKLINSETGKPIENIEISLITLEKIFTTKTNNNGEYKLILPENYIDKKENILHFDFGGYNDKNFILSKAEIQNKIFNFKSSETDTLVVVAGGITSRKLEPTIFLDGEEISEAEYYKLTRKDFKFFSFFGKFAKALYTEATDDGIILIYSK